MTGRVTTYQTLLKELTTRRHQGPAIWPNMTAEDLLKKATAEGQATDALHKKTESARIGAHMRMAEARLNAAENCPEAEAPYYLHDGDPLKRFVLAHYKLAGIPPDQAFVDRLDAAQKQMHRTVAEYLINDFEVDPYIRNLAGIDIFLQGIRERFRAGGIAIHDKSEVERRLRLAGARAAERGLRADLDYFAKTDIPLLTHIRPHQTPPQITAEWLEIVRRYNLKSELLFEVRRVGERLCKQYGFSTRPEPRDKPAQVFDFPQSR